MFGFYRAIESQLTTGQQLEDGQRLAATNPACQASDIVVEKLHARRVGNHTIITGRLVNNCSLPTGAQIKITAYDGAGEILSVDDIWPASVSNIPARSAFPFEWIADPGLKTVTGEVIKVKTWTQPS